MKVNFSLYSPAGKDHTGVDFSAIKNVDSNAPVLKNNAQDVFVKSSPVFGSNEKQDADKIREDVVKAGKEGVVEKLAMYTKLYMSALGSKTLKPALLDVAFVKHINSCCADPSNYPFDGDYPIYPNKEEFREIVVGLWQESKRREYEPNTMNQRPASLCTLDNVKTFVKKDFARALNKYSMDYLGEPIKNKEDAKKLADVIYYDESTKIPSEGAGQAYKKNGLTGFYFGGVRKRFDNPRALLEYLLKYPIRIFDKRSKSMYARREEYEYKIRREEELVNYVPSSKHESPYWGDGNDWTSF